MTISSHEQDLLLHSSLFEHCGAEFLSYLLTSPHMKIIEYFSGDVVYSPEQFLNCLGIVLSGQLHVTKGTLTVSQLECGDLFGAAALYSDCPEYATTITAKQNSRCLMLNQVLVDDLLAENKQIRENYLRYLTGRIRFLSGRLQSLSQMGAEGKLARYLLSNAKIPENTFTCSATELAKRLGLSRASLYRAFDTLEHHGLITRHQKTIFIPSRSALEGVL